MEISGENYSVTYDSATATITCKGSLRLYGAAGYASVADLFSNVANEKPAVITLRVNELQFLNSSGINAFSKFVINVRNNNVSKLIVEGSHQYSWQSKSLKNLQRLMPDLELKLE